MNNPKRKRSTVKIDNAGSILSFHSSSLTGGSYPTDPIEQDYSFLLTTKLPFYSESPLKTCIDLAIVIKDSTKEFESNTNKALKFFQNFENEDSFELTGKHVNSLSLILAYAYARHSHYYCFLNELFEFYKEFRQNPSFRKTSVDYFSKSPQHKPPSVFLTLTRYFFSIKTLQIKLSSLLEKHKPKHCYLVLMNLFWLFPNAFKVKLDLHTADLLVEPEKIVKAVKENSKTCWLILILLYFISNKNILFNLEVDLKASYSLQFQSFLQQNEIAAFDFSPLKLLTKVNSLVELSSQLNCLNPNVVEQLVELLNANPEVFSVNLSFFPSDEHFNLSQLKRMFEFLITQNKFICALNNRRRLSDAEDEYYADNLIELFKNNLNCLFSCLVNKMTVLTQLNLEMTLPQILLYNGKYIKIVKTFIYNVLSSYDGCTNGPNELTVESKNLVLEPDESTLSNKICNCINLEGNKSIQTMKLSFRFVNFAFKTHWFPSNLRFLEIESLDLFSLKSFAAVLKLSLKRVECLSVGLTRVTMDTEEVIEAVKEICRATKYSVLNKLSIVSNIPLVNQQLEEVMLLFDRDFIKHFSIQISKNKVDFTQFKPVNLTALLPDTEKATKLAFCMKSSSRTIYRQFSLFTGSLKDKVTEIQFV